MSTARGAPSAVPTHATLPGFAGGRGSASPGHKGSGGTGLPAPFSFLTRSHPSPSPSLDLL